MLAGVKGVKMKHDFCYLSNPHATELFLRYFRKDFRNEERLRRVVEYYPSQNCALAEKIAAFLAVTQKTHSLSVSHSKEGERIQAENIFVGNGATEIIQAALQNFTKKKILVPVPTFSPYLEFASKDVSVIQHQLRKKDDFRLNRAELLTQVRKEEPDTVVLINPNNPDGGYIEVEDVHGLLTQLRHVPTVIVDESFAHFVAQKIGYATSLVQKFPNLVVIKSLSKDFGIAGVRLGYAVMSAHRVSALLKRGYLWNVSGFGEYFLGLLNRRDFLRQYEQSRQKAIRERDEFFVELSKIKGLHVYPSRANMFLVELTDGSQAADLVVAFLVRYGIYVRLCKDKIGLHGEFVRIASRSGVENRRVISALRAELSV